MTAGGLFEAVAVLLSATPVVTGLTQKMSITPGTYNEVACPAGEVIVAGYAFMYKEKDGLSCIKKNKNNAMCTLGATKCVQSGCDSVGMRSFIWAVCDSVLPLSREAHFVNGDTNSISATCSQGKRIAFGLSFHWSDKYSSSIDTCLGANFQACTVGDQACATNFCSTDGNDEQVLYMICEEGASKADMPYEVVFSAQTTQNHVLGCPVGYDGVFGHTIHLNTEATGRSCSDDSASTFQCPDDPSTGKNTICTHEACDDVGLDSVLMVMACAQKKCPAPSAVPQALVSCISTTYISGSVCTVTCKPGFHMSDGVTSAQITCTPSGTGVVWTSAPTCVDIKECASSPCDALTTCIEEEGSFSCSSCPPGYDTVQAPHMCKDQNECLLNDPCEEGSICANTPGSHICTPFIVANSIRPGAGSSLLTPPTPHGVVVASSVMGGSEVVFTVHYPKKSKDVVVVWFGYKNVDDLEAPEIQCQQSNSPQISNGQLVAPEGEGDATVTCVLGPGVGWRLRPFLQACVGALCWDAIGGQDSGNLFKFPDPIVSPSSLRLTAGPVGSGDANLQMGFGIQKIFIDGANFVNIPYAISVRYGGFKCQVDTDSTTNVLLSCFTDSAGSGEDLPITLVVANGPTITTGLSITYMQPTGPAVSKVHGCDSDPKNINATINCPTEGQNIIIEGRSFDKDGKGAKVLVSGNECFVVQQTELSITCRLPEGTGFLHTIVVQSGGMSSPPVQLLSYGAAKIEELAGCDRLLNTDGFDATACDREGGNELDIRGTNFGAKGATIYVGGKPCETTNHDLNDPHSRLTCKLPAFRSQRANLQILQLNGALSESNFTLFSKVCQAGQYAPESGVACTNCTAGSYSPQVGGLECVACPVGRVSEAEGSGSCSACPAGTYRNASGSRCALCQAGTYSAEEGRESCLLCPVGTEANSTGAWGCSECLPGKSAAAPGSSACANCTAGTLAEYKGLETCADCPKGFVSRASGASACEHCLAGSYQDKRGQTACKVCSAGTYQGVVAQWQCSQCEPGYFSNNNSLTACMACLEGQYQSEGGKSKCEVCEAGSHSAQPGTDQCQKCLKGTYGSSAGLSACLACQPGSFQSEQGEKKCELCKPGTATSLEGQAECAPCPQGQFAQLGAQECEPCPPGTKTPRLGALACEVCEAGTFAANFSSVCTPCEEGRIAHNKQSGACTKCPIHSKSNWDVTQCKCDAGYYLKGDERTGLGECKVCPEGTVCQGGDTISTVSALPGWSRRNVSQALVVDSCLSVNHCRGGTEKGCTEFRTGPICALCISGYGATSASSGCSKCQESATGFIVLMFLILAVALCIMYYLVLYGDHLFKQPSSNMSFAVRHGIKSTGVEFHSPVGGMRSSSRSYSSKAGEPTPAQLGQSASSPMASTLALASDKIVSQTDLKTSNTISFQTEDNNGVEMYDPTASGVTLTFPLKIVITFFQIMTTLTAIATVPWPVIFVDFVSSFKFFNIDFIPWQSISCAVPGMTFYDKVKIITLVPFGLVLALSLGFLLPMYILERHDMADENTMREKRRLHRNQFGKLVCFSFFLIYPLVSTTVFGLFECYKHDGSFYMVNDFKLLCYDDAWYGELPFAVLAILLYPVGIPLVFFVLMYRRRALLYHDPMTKVSLGFLYEAYVPGMWWFEILDMMHKLFLTSMVLFIPNEAQLPCAMIINASYSIAIMLVAPYTRQSDDRLALLAQAEVFLLLLAAYTLDSMGAERMNSSMEVVLGVFMCVIVVLFVVCLLMQLFVSTKKYYRAALARKRNKASKEPYAQVESFGAQSGGGGTFFGNPVLVARGASLRTSHFNSTH